MSISDEEIENRLGYHKATFPDGVSFMFGSQHAGELDERGATATAPLHAAAREAFIALAKQVRDLTPDGREQALALTTLQESLMWTNAAIAMTAPLVDES